MHKSCSISMTIVIVVMLLHSGIYARKFIHPGIDQSAEDLNYMKMLVVKGEQPWKDAFDRLKSNTDLNFGIKPYTHVVRGGYGNPNIGGGDLSNGARMAYDCALLWYITGEKKYAEKAIQIINAWSPVLWDFDDNDAKLLAGWTGHQFCNAAEILRYTDSGWKKSDQESFTRMLMTVYYPLIRYYYPQANGNWDGAIIHSILAIAIFTDNQEMFDNAIDHFLHGPVNGSIFKYIYPGGQCQESMRDQGHVQLGLGEFAGAAQVAYTQGVDLFSLGNNRIALGYEYTAQFLLGEKPHCYGIISQRAKNIRDDYEYVYRHYTSKGLEMPFTKMAADSVRAKASRSILTAVRKPSGIPVQKSGTPKPSAIGYPAGAMEKATERVPEGAILISPGQSIQDALNSAAGSGKWIIAKAGLHTLPATLRIPSGITLAGEGLKTILFLSPNSGNRDAIVNAENNMHDVTLRDLVVECATSTEIPSDPNSRRSYRSSANRGGIFFLAQKERQIKNISLINITLQNATNQGVFICGAENVKVICCDFNENGASVVPGPKLQHNLLLTHCSDVIVRDCRLDTSPNGSGLSIGKCNTVKVENNEIARNGYYGILIAESDNISITGNLIEGNDRSGVMIEYLDLGSENITVSSNLIQFNNGYGLESYASRNIKSVMNSYSLNGNSNKQEKISKEKYIVMK